MKKEENMSMEEMLAAMKEELRAEFNEQLEAREKEHAEEVELLKKNLNETEKKNYTEGQKKVMLERAILRKMTEEEENLVSVVVPFDPRIHDTEMEVMVNGKTYRLKRGETNMVPSFVADLLEDADRQQNAAYKMQRGLEDEFESKLHE